MSFSFSVVIPVWFEASGINSRIAHVLQRAKQGDYEVEVIVADGDPQTSTLKAISDDSVKKIAAPQGRAVQMNAGAAAAEKDVLLFLHADTELPENAFGLIEEAFSGGKQSGAKAGAFALSIASDRLFLYLITVLGNWRNKLTRTPYGDQAQFFIREYFEKLGGYPAIPIMEDVEIMRMIRRQDDDLALIDTPVSTSARRWESEGMVKCTLRNLLLRSLYGAGVSAQTLSHWYRAMKG